MRYLIIALFILLSPVVPANAEVSVSIGFNVPVYPDLVLVPGYPVYYDPRADSNYFFYDGNYWVYQDDTWYSSSWYNGPWRAVGPQYVPLFVLRVPVRYYRRPPTYFQGWGSDAPPHWGEHWGPGWQNSRRGWDQWNHRAIPHAAPLPVYQRQYSKDRYPRAPTQQHAIQSKNYHYRPRQTVARPEPQKQAPVRQRPQPDQQPNQQQRQQPDQQRPQGQSVNAPPNGQHPQARPQDKDRKKQAGPRDKGRDNQNDDRGRDHP